MAGYLLLDVFDKRCRMYIKYKDNLISLVDKTSMQEFKNLLTRLYAAEDNHILINDIQTEIFQKIIIDGILDSNDES